MKKSLLRSLIIVIAFFSSSQIFAQTFGVKAGLNWSSMPGQLDEYLDGDFMNIRGFHTGGTVEFPSDRPIALETGLFVSTRGYIYKIDFDPDGLYRQQTNEFLYYLDIPFTIKKNIDISREVKLFFNFGLFAGLGLTGKYKTIIQAPGVDDQIYKDPIKWGSDNDEYKRLDYGYTLGLGVEVYSLFVSGSFNDGLANISNNDDYKINHRVFQISLGYKFSNNLKASTW